MKEDYKLLLKVIGFSPKDGAVEVYRKEYKQHNYTIEVDFLKEKICYGDLIGADCKTTQNFSQAENWVVLECVDRLLEKGYKPQNIILEKTWAAGHGTSGRLDICVTRDDGSEYLLIECKTYGKEFDKAVAKLNKDGGQLFTYFKFSNKADVIMLYTSELQGKEFVYKNEIVKIEDDYRVGDVKDFYDKWNKLTKDNGVFETWVEPYCFESKALIKSQLKPINQEDSSFIFNRFLEILRHNVVSDKGNAFNKIFTLFLCKVYDETSKAENEELDFQWKEGVDTDVSFQLRLTDLYKNGMEVFLSRIVSDFDEQEFENKYKHLSKETKDELLKEINTLRLEKNNEFAIKEVYDHDSFVENAKIVKEVVELLQSYRIRYNKRQQYLSDFFELLLTTGLKQEAGQFFTPVPIAQFIIKSLPLEKIVDEKLKQKNGELLPYMIDYAAGSGHFITEYMHEVQAMIDNKLPNKYIETTSKKIKNWQSDPYDWATDYVYGIEKDYRLVKVGKVGCYLHGDGLANVILSDGLGNFVNTKDYKGKLHKDNDDNSRDNQQFDIILSNPPYSVSAFRQTTRDYYTEKDFDLYDKLTDNSSEIECLFVERTKQLLKDGGVAGIILPSSILTNSGIYTKTRELLLKYFEIVGITELGSNTFMATGTNTVVLFLRRRNNYECINLEKSVDKFFSNHTDVTINGIETPVTKYINYVWEGLSFEDYLTLLDQKPNDKVKNHDLFKEYSNKIKSDKDFWNKIIELEKEKIFYFILAYPQKLVIVNTGNGINEEREFLGYIFSHSRGQEGIHSYPKGKSIDECTKLFDINSFNNPQKASTYIHKAFENNFEFTVDEQLKKNITIAKLLDLMIFDRSYFEKDINTNAKKKVKIESKYSLVKIKEISSNIINGSTPSTNIPEYWEPKEIDWATLKDFKSLYITETEQKISKKGLDKVRLVPKDSVLVSCTATLGKIAIAKRPLTTNQQINAVVCNDKILPRYFAYVMEEIGKNMQYLTNNVGVKHINQEMLNNIQVPLPPLDIQQKIVDEIEKIENENKKINEKINVLNQKLHDLLDKLSGKSVKLGDICESYIGLTYKPEEIDSNGILVLRSSNIKNGKLDLTDQVRVNSKIRDNLYVKNGDVLVCVRNGSKRLLGKAAYIENINGQMTFGAFMAICRSSIGKYIYIWMQSENYIKQVEKLGTTMSINQLTQKMLMNLEIPMLSEKDQQSLVIEYNELEKQIAQAQIIIDNLKQQKQAILDKYLK